MCLIQVGRVYLPAQEPMGVCRARGLGGIFGELGSGFLSELV